jgi:hypothetical protein
MSSTVSFSNVKNDVLLLAPIPFSFIAFMSACASLITISTPGSVVLTELLAIVCDPVAVDALLFCSAVLSTKKVSGFIDSVNVRVTVAVSISRLKVVSLGIEMSSKKPPTAT